MFELATIFAAAAVAVTVPATYDEKAGRYCIRAVTLEAAAQAGTHLYRRECLTRGQWRVRGIAFRPAAPDAT